MDMTLSICILHMFVSETIKQLEAVDGNCYTVITPMSHMQVVMLVVPLLVDLQQEVLQCSLCVALW